MKIPQTGLNLSGGGEGDRKKSLDSYDDSGNSYYRGRSISEREESQDLELSGFVPLEYQNC